MTKIEQTDPIHFPTKSGEDHVKKHRAGKSIVLGIAAIGIVAFVVYMAMIVITTTQS